MSVENIMSHREFTTSCSETKSKSNEFLCNQLWKNIFELYSFFNASMIFLLMVFYLMKSYLNTIKQISRAKYSNSQNTEIIEWHWNSQTNLLENK